MFSNFSFLESHWPDLALIGSGAEQNLHIDPGESVQLLGVLGQRVLWHMALCEKMKAPRDMPYGDLLRLLRRGGMVPKRVDDLLYSLRRGAAAVSRGEAASVDMAGLRLSLAHHLCVWMDGTYGDAEGPLAHSFTLPSSPSLKS